MLLLKKLSSITAAAQHSVLNCLTNKWRYFRQNFGLHKETYSWSRILKTSSLVTFVKVGLSILSLQIHRPKSMTTIIKSFWEILYVQKARRCIHIIAKRRSCTAMDLHTVIGLEVTWSILANQNAGTQVESNSIFL